MTLSQEQYANDDDSILIENLKLQNWVEVSSILEKSPDLVRHQDQYGNLPLHTSIGFSAPLNIILRILSLYPQAAAIHGSNEWLPLHIAAMYSTDTEILEQLVRVFPEGLDDEGQGGVKGRTPKHFATRWGENGKEILLRSVQEWKDLVKQDQ